MKVLNRMEIRTCLYFSDYKKEPRHDSLCLTMTSCNIPDWELKQLGSVGAGQGVIQSYNKKRGASAGWCLVSTPSIPPNLGPPLRLSGGQWNCSCAARSRTASELPTAARDSAARRKVLESAAQYTPPSSALSRHWNPAKQSQPQLSPLCGVFLPVSSYHHGVAHPQVEAGSKRHRAKSKTQAWTSSGGDQGPHGGLRRWQWGHRWRASCLQHRWGEDRCQKEIQNGGGLFWKVVKFFAKSRHNFDNSEACSLTHPEHILAGKLFHTIWSSNARNISKGSDARRRFINCAHSYPNPN